MSNTIDLDFTGVKSYNNLTEGTHSVKVQSAEIKKAQTGSDQLQVTFEKDGATKTAWYSLVPTALWKVKRLLEALGIAVPDGKMRLDIRQIIGKYCTIVIEQDPNDPTREIVTREYAFGKDEESNAVPFAPVAEQPIVEQAPVAQPTIPTQPQPTAPQGNLPPWMAQQASAQQAVNPSQPQGNIPPWMR